MFQKEKKPARLAHSPPASAIARPRLAEHDAARLVIRARHSVYAIEIRYRLIWIKGSIAGRGIVMPT